MKNLLDLFQKKKKAPAPSYKPSDFTGKYHETPSDQQKITETPTKKPDDTPPEYVPVASKDSFLPEHFTVESPSAKRIRFFIQLTELLKIALIVGAAFGVGILLWNINHNYQIYNRLYDLFKTLQENTT